MDEVKQCQPALDASRKALFMATRRNAATNSVVLKSPRSLSKIKGVRSAKVNWQSKNAKLEFDESLISAQEITLAINKTPHMMGSGQRYGGWLALKVPSVKDNESAKRVKEIAGKIPGVKQVAAYPAQNSIGIQFDNEGKVTSDDVIKALEKAEIKAERF